MNSACSPSVFVGPLQVLWWPFFCDQAATCPGCSPLLHHRTAGMSSSSHSDPECRRSADRRWMDG